MTDLQNIVTNMEPFDKFLYCISNGLTPLKKPEPVEEIKEEVSDNIIIYDDIFLD